MSSTVMRVPATTGLPIITDGSHVIKSSLIAGKLSHGNPRLTPQVRDGQEARRLSVARRLLVGVGDAQELRFGEGATVEAYADGESINITRGHLYVRVSGDGGGRGTAAGEVVAVEEVCRPRGTARRRDDGVEIVFPYHCVQPLRLRESLAGLERLNVCEGFVRLI